MLDILIIFFGLGIYPLILGFFYYAFIAIWWGSSLHGIAALKFFITMVLFAFMGKFFSNVDINRNKD